MNGCAGQAGSDTDRRIALRFVASGTFKGDFEEIEVAGFLKIKDQKMTELRFVTDLTVFNEMRTAAGFEPFT